MNEMIRTATPRDIWHGCALFVFVERPEGALFGAAFALRAALHGKLWIGLVFPARVDGQAAGSQLDRLDRLQRGAHSIFSAGVGVVRCANAARRVDASPPCFVGKADEMRIGKLVFEHRQVGSLPIGQVQDVRSLVLLEPFISVPAKPEPISNPLVAGIDSMA